MGDPIAKPAPGTDASDGLTGRGMQQSRQEWDLRNRTLVDSMGGLVDDFLAAESGRAIDVGCQQGALTDAMAERTALSWSGIDPRIEAATTSPGGAELFPGFAHDLPFESGSCACTMLANVYEHIAPDRRRDSLAELYRVLAPGGIVVGQLPNPYFPIESHSRLPFMGWLPVRAQKAYWRLAPVPWEHDFYVVTVADVRRNAVDVGFEVALVRNFNYPAEVIPRSLRWAARVMERPMQRFPWAWQFVLRRPEGSRASAERR
jgi:SAM-dependent methyltransferase